MNDRSELDASRIYVIGDIHGRLDLLDNLIGKIEADLKSAPTPEALTVTLGDYIDRGPNSRGVLTGTTLRARYEPTSGWASVKQLYGTDQQATSPLDVSMNDAGDTVLLWMEWGAKPELPPTYWVARLP